MIYVVRHGETERNRAHALQGRSDAPLNARGQAQAAELGRALAARGVRFAHVFSSPLVRAVQTANLVASGVEACVDERLIEMDYGPYEGADLRNPAPELAEFFRDFVHNPAPEGTEPLSAVVARTGAFVEGLTSLDGDVLISTHAIAMKGILEYLTPGSEGRYWSTYVGNCAVYVVPCEDGSLGVPCELKLS